LKVKAIVVDMDGTITKFNLNFMKARRQALEILEEMNLRTSEMNEQISLYIILASLKEKLDPETYASVRSKFYTLLEEMELKSARHVTLYPGARETLLSIRRRSIKMGIVTNNGHAGTELTFKRLKLQGIFDAIVTRDDCEDMKPSPNPVLKIMAELGAKPEEGILVGDGLMDIMAAKAAGLSSVAVTTGPFNSARLVAAEPDYVLASINDLPDLLDSLDGKATKEVAS
jgi:HAD superfamily hydrolase (TIGR01549 family)